MKTLEKREMVERNKVRHQIQKRNHSKETFKFDSHMQLPTN